jgi:hydrophobic/amphiphilic exporter-1 (mainly G- bacteria), HAE1 family
MGLTRSAILRPVAMTMLVVALLVLGYTSLGKMGVDLYPNIDFPYISITTIYLGSGPREIETQITKPIEDSVSLISGVKTVTSSSQDGFSQVLLEFHIGTNLDTAVADVRANVDAIRAQLPKDIESPVVTKANIASLPVLEFGISSPRPSREIRDLADNVIKQRLAKVDGVAAVGVAGGDVREIEVAVDKNRLEAYGLTVSQVNQALVGENLNLPSGTIKQQNKEYAVRAVGEFSSLEEIKNVRIKAPSGAVVTLKDLAEITDSVAERTTFTRLNGKDSVTISILKQAGANTVAVANGVKQELQLLTGQDFSREPGLIGKLFSPKKPAGETVRGILPSDIKIETGFDQSTHILDTLDEVRMSLLLGALFAVIIVFIFLHNIRGTFIVAIAIPTSILATFAPAYFAGFTLNMMVLLALSLSVGILVDDSIVVLENIWRHLRKGEAPKDAALNGRTEIGLAAITITMVDVVVFVPIAFMGGIVGQFFRQFGLTVAIATLFSLFVSFTLTPMLASRWFRKKDVEEEAGAGPGGRFFAAFDRFYGTLDRQYRALLDWALDHRGATVFTGLVALLGCLGIVNGGIEISAGLAALKTPAFKIVETMTVLFLLGLGLSRGAGRKVLVIVFLLAVSAVAFTHRKLGFEMFPSSDTGNFQISVDMPVGSSLLATSNAVKELESHLLDKKAFPEVENVFSTIGSSGGSFAGLTGQDATKADISVVLVERSKRSRGDLPVMDQADQWAKANLPGAKIKSLLTGSIGGPPSAPIQIVLTGEDIDKLVSLGHQLMTKMAQIKGTKDIDISWDVGRPELQARMDRVALADQGLSTTQVAGALRTSLEGSADTKFRSGGNEYDIRVRLQAPDRANLANVGTLAVANNGNAVHLEDVANLQMAAGPNKIDRRNRQRAVTVSAALLPGYFEGNVTDDIKKNILDKMNFGEISYTLAGETSERQESFGNVNTALGLSVILVYILMAALFEGYLSPLIIMFSLPMALVGALLALVLSNSTLSIVAMIGIIMLMGLVTKNAILLVDYTNTLRSRGLERREAILQAGPTRLRPILMTTLAMIFGMLPVAFPSVFHLVSGAEWRAPMALAVMGGLIVSTLLTLLVIPVLYTVLDDIGGFYTRIRKRRSPGFPESQAPRE